ncbi:MAG: hypothetical protein GXZ08_10215 [Tissierellia bacterium]|nr:hypothetical protein [Tissierellia bacterium]
MIREGLNKAKWSSLIIGILLILSGIMFYTNPMATLVSVSTWIAVVLIATGIIKIVRYFANDVFKQGSFLIIGILEIVLGGIMISTQPVTAITLAMFVGFWEIFTGVSEIVTSIDLKKFDFPRWWVGFISGILGIVLGFMIIKNPTLTGTLVSIYAIVYGVTFVSTFFAINSLLKKYE